MAKAMDVSDLKFDKVDRLWRHGLGLAPNIGYNNK